VAKENQVPIVIRSAPRLVALLLSLAVAAVTHAQTADDLSKAIGQMDRMLFDAFNSRDLETQKKIFAKDIEFFHDTSGLIDYRQLIENTERLFAQNNGLKRTLVPGSLEVYPIPNYGAIQIGQHTFCHDENGRPDCGTFRFVHVWRKRDDRWELTRVVSYGH
jgi:ketosteroid isomerase-like protein